MSTEIVITQQVRSDVDGTMLEPQSGWRVRFAYEGQDLQLDLTDEQREEYDNTLGRWAQLAVHIGGAPRKSDCATRIGTEVDIEQQQPITRALGTKHASSSRKVVRPGIREFGIQNGFVPAGFAGRMPAAAEEAYDLAFGIAS